MRFRPRQMTSCGGAVLTDRHSRRLHRESSRRCGRSRACREAVSIDSRARSQSREMVRGVCRARARGGTLGRSSPFHQQSPGSARADRCVHVIPGRQAMRGESFDEMGAMLKRPFGIILLAGALLIAGLVGMAAFWRVVPRTSNTSPLAALFALIWSCTNLVTATLTWRRSRLAPPSFLAAIGLLLFPASFIAPGGQLFFPSFMVIVLVAFLGYRYLRRARQPPPSGR
jgi:hypothetical protein